MSDVSLETLSQTDDWHPRTMPPEPQEFDEEQLQAKATQLVGILVGRTSNHARFPKAVLVEHCRALREALYEALEVLEPTQNGAIHDSEITCPKNYMAGLERVMRWIWMDGAADQLKGSIRACIAARFIAPGMMSEARQVDLMKAFGRKFKQEINEHQMDFVKSFHYFDQLMRSDESRANMSKSYHQRQDHQ